MCTTCMALRPQDPTCPYTADQTGGATAGGASGGDVWSHDQIADQLTTGYWSGGPYKFDVAPGGTLTYDISGLTAAGQTLATMALQAWSDVSGIQFLATSGSADIVFDDEDSGAYASFFYSGGTIHQAWINVSTSWISGSDTIDSYGFQTYLHEVGHALGLGHAGNYNGGATYGIDNLFANDSWQATVMSYFSQTQNTAVSASFAYAISPMIADIVAIQSLYGTAGVRTGDTVYGRNGNTGTYLDAWLTLGNAVALTIADTGGHDTIDLSGTAIAQRLDLRAEAVSDIDGLTGNLVIARDTVIEAAFTGDGDDTVTGNGGDNTISLGAGSDLAHGAEGADLIEGDDGFDWLDGGAGADALFGGAQADNLWGGSGDDSLYGEEGNDRLFGGIGDDTGEGGSGDDVFFGEAGRDLGRGGAGDDRLYGGGDADTLEGGDGNDLLDGGFQEDRLIGGLGDDTLEGGAGFDWLEGGDGRDVLRGGAQADNLFGGAGDDTLEGEGGADRLFGEDGNDRITGGGQFDRIWGGEGNDLIDGAGGGDALRGGAGFDTILGGAGDDTLRGDFNADIFVFRDGDGSDVIEDFDASNGFEKIDLTGLSAITDFADLAANHLSQDGPDAIITSGTGEVIRLTGVAMGDLDETDFLF